MTEQVSPEYHWHPTLCAPGHPEATHQWRPDPVGGGSYCRQCGQGRPPASVIEADENILQAKLETLERLEAAEQV